MGGGVSSSRQKSMLEPIIHEPVLAHLGLTHEAISNILDKYQKAVLVVPPYMIAHRQEELLKYYDKPSLLLTASQSLQTRKDIVEIFATIPQVKLLIGSPGILMKEALPMVDALVFSQALVGECGLSTQARMYKQIVANVNGMQRTAPLNIIYTVYSLPLRTRMSPKDYLQQRKEVHG